MPALAAPDIQVSFGLSYTTVSGLVLVAPLVVGLLLEPPLYLLADRYPRRWFVCGGLLAMGLALIIAGLATSVWVFALAMAGWYVGSGCGVGLSQATLIDSDPERGERLMTRWTLLGSIGDLAAPLLVAGLAWLAIGWRGAFVIGGALVVLWSLVMRAQSFPGDARAGDPGEDMAVVSLRSALRNRRLIVWLFGCWLCELMDEILVVFASLHLRDELGVGPATQALVLGCFTVWSMLGLALVERYLSRHDPLRVLQVAAAACALTYLLWLTTTSIAASATLLFVVGLTCAPLYPIAMAQAYRALPGASGTVHAVGNVFMPATVVLTLGLGWLADHIGLAFTLMVLVLQPLGLYLIASVRSK